MIIICDPDRGFQSQVARFLASDEPYQQVRAPEDVEAVLAELDSNVDVILIGPSVAVEEALDRATWLQRRAPEVSIILVAESVSRDLLQTALRAGVRDVLSMPLEEGEFRDALLRAGAVARQLRGRGHTEHKVADVGKVVTVFSSKGGCGKSVVASNLAIMLAQRTGREVGLVDLDLQSGDLAIMLQLLPAYTIYDAADQSARLDEEAMRAYLTAHRSGVQLLAAPSEPAQADAVSPEAVKKILSYLREMFPYVVIDAPPAFTETILVALDETDEVALVTSMDVPSIKNLKLSLQTLDQLGVGRERIRLVLNRADSKVGLRLQEVEKTLGTPIDVALPSSRDVPLSVNQGTPLALEGRKSPVIGALGRLVDLVSNAPPRAEASTPKRGIFSRA